LRESLNDRWGSFLSLHIEFNDETRRAINADPVCLTVIREIFSEFVVNAVKHAQAEMVKLVLGVVGDRVEIVFSNSISATDVEAVADASSGASAHEKGGPSVRVGVGSQLIESVLLDRQLTTTSDEYRLSGALPLQETLPSATI
jgi:two-component sensor histidine kinase